MKRSLMCSSALALGLFAWSAQGQQQPAQPGQPGQVANPAQPAGASQQNQNPQAQQNQNPQAQPNQVAQPNQQAQPNQNPNQQAQPNQGAVQAPNANQQAQPNQPNQQAQPNQPNANVQTGVQGGAQVGAQGAQVGVQGGANVGQGTMVNGRIVRTAQDQFVVQGVDNKSYTFYTNPQTRYWMNNNPIQYSGLQVGSNISAWYAPQGERYYVNRVNVLPAGAAFPVQEATTTQTTTVDQQANAPNANYYQGEIVRIVGRDQVVIRTSDGKEVIVYVQPQTTYRLEDRAATFTDLRPGTPIRVDYDMRDRRPYARGILGLRRDRR